MPRSKPFSIPDLRKDNPSFNPFDVLQRDVEEPESQPVRSPAPHKTPLHFVWYGTGKPNDANTKTPKALAANFASATVYFWCMPQMAPEFEKALGKRVKVHGLDEVLEAPAVRKELGAMMMDRLDQLLDFYLANKGYAPAKDILTFLTLALNGGYFFDANCVIEVPKQFEKALARPPAVPTFLKLGDMLSFNDRHPSFMKSDLALQMGMEEEDTDTVTPFNGTDMWAMYAPPRHRMMWTIARHYISRAEAFGFCGATARTGSMREEIRDYFINGLGQQKRTLAGALGIQSIFAGMAEHKVRHAQYKPEDVNWEVASVKNGAIESTGVALSPASANADYWVKDLGLTKGHGDSWTK
ncbi:hypothetical protein D7W79_31915 [Corallococcus exercitus]|uniref:hypothetical protein n=1 Tax=Corallococcus exercitus TaxID=2316736 RepID=UPI000EA3A1F5|nr:hypothetical protein [Corallococcus exercitus]RKG70378.1 hypothetical protein D7W79_31915 [Corallococcus exercitus]